MLEIRLLGPTVTRTDGTGPAKGVSGVKPRQLLGMLALDLGSPLSKDLIADRLWEGRPPPSWLATIESYVCVLRRQLGLGHGREAILATTSYGYRLDPDRVVVDVVDVRSLLRGGPEDVSRALDRMSGELLADEPYLSWAIEERESFDEVVSQACLRAAGDANLQGEPALAVRLARSAQQRCPFSEPALRELMRALNHSGSRVMALQAYESLRLAMESELGVEPSAETRATYQSILEGGGSPGSAHEAHRDEVRTLLELLRRALAEDTGVLAGLPYSHEVGALLLARAS